MSYDPYSTPPRREDPLGPEDPLGEPPLPVGPGFTEGSKLPRNIAAVLACIFPLITGIIFYIVDRRDEFVRFYALQSIVLGAFFCVLGLCFNLSGAILHIIPLLGPIFSKLFALLSSISGIVFLILWMLLIFNSYRGKLWEMPILWRLARRHIPQALL